MEYNTVWGDDTLITPARNRSGYKEDYEPPEPSNKTTAFESPKAPIFPPKIQKMELAITTSLSDKSKWISEKEFTDWVESISVVENKELRSKMSKAFFMHLASIFSSGLR